MKSGPRNGLYRTLLEGRYNGEPPSISRSLSNRENNRRGAVRALYRRIHDRKKFRELGSWVRSIRKSLGKSQSKFAEMVGVSTITVKRWENGLGHMPTTWKGKNKKGKPIPSNMDRLKQLEALSKDLKKSNLEIEEP